MVGIGFFEKFVAFKIWIFSMFCLHWSLPLFIPVDPVFLVAEVRYFMKHDDESSWAILHAVFSFTIRCHPPFSGSSLSTPRKNCKSAFFVVDKGTKVVFLVFFCFKPLRMIPFNYSPTIHETRPASVVQQQLSLPASHRPLHRRAGRGVRAGGLRPGRCSARLT